MSTPLPPATGPSALSAAPPVAPAVATPAVAATAPVPAALPAATALQLSAQAQQALRLQVFQNLVAQLVTQIQSGAQAAAPQWPTAGVTPALQDMLGALIAQVTAGLPQPQQLVAAQAWPQAWVNALLPGSASAMASAGSPAAGGQGAAAASTPGATGMDAGGASAASAPRLPPMQTWLVQQGVVQTPQGERGFAFTLQVPQAWAQLQAAASVASPAAPAASAMAGGPLQLPFAAPMQQLESGALALVLQSAAAGSAAQGVPSRTSALLWLDFQPLPPAAPGAQSAVSVLAGLLPSPQMAQQLQATLQPRNDPWLQMAALQASGQQPREDPRWSERRTGLCDDPGCPYRGKASCAQPFCAELNRVWAAARLDPL